MNLLEISKPMLLSSTLLFFTACGGGDGGTTTDSQEIAIDRLEAYAANNNNPPTLEDYLDAGVQGVNDDNLDEINAVVNTLDPEDVDSVEEINALVSQLGINIIPVAKAQSVSLNEDSSKVIVLEGTDIDSDALTYSIVTNPIHGTLTGTVPNLTYTPNPNYHGLDSFTFKVNDGEADSSTAKVSITVKSINDTPQAKAQLLSLNEDSPKSILLEGTDADGDTLTYILVTQPTKGTLRGTAPNLTYIPNLNYFGTDSFSFKVNDTKVDSEVVTVDLNINPINDIPTVDAGVDRTVEVNQGIRLAATGSDVEGAVGFVWRNGDKVLAQIPVFDYVPTEIGPEYLTVTVTDNEGVSVSDSMLLMVVEKANIAPIAEEQTLTFEEDSLGNQITLTATDADNDTLAYTVVTQPTHGVLTGVAPNLTYTPAADYFGEDAFEFKVNDGKVDSSVVTVAISVSSVNDAPVLQKNNLTVSFDEHNVSNLVGQYIKAESVDIDGDGDIDIVFGTYNENIAGTTNVIWYENDGSQNFIEHNISIAGHDVWQLKTIDFDKDGDIDVLTTSMKTEEGVIWYENDGSENFIEHNLSSSYSVGLDLEDVDNDGDIDFVTTSSGFNDISLNTFRWYENDGSQNFIEHNISNRSISATLSIKSIDLDKDGDIDIIPSAFIYNESTYFIWYENDGSQNFIEHNISIYTDSFFQNFSADIADIDNDGDNDIITSYHNREDENGTIIWYENDGSENFIEHTITSTKNLFSTGLEVQIIDIDNDGDNDIISGNSWYENDGIYNFIEHSITDSFSTYFTMSDIDSDGDVDIALPYWADDAIVWQENLGLTTIYVKENNTTVGTISAIDVDGDSLTYSISGTDADKFNINAATGVLTFNDAPDHENPIDDDEDNVYEFSVAVTDDSDSDELEIRVIVEKEDEPEGAGE